MTTQDLTTNRDRIIKKIKSQTSNPLAVKGVMTKMVNWLSSREDIKSMKPTMANIDKFTVMVTLNWIKVDMPNFMYNTDGSKNYEAINNFNDQREEAKRTSHSNFF